MPTETKASAGAKSLALAISAHCIHPSDAFKMREAVELIDAALVELREAARDICSKSETLIEFMDKRGELARALAAWEPNGGRDAE